VPLNLFWATMRFLGDAAPALTLAATCAWWLWYGRLRERPSRRRLVVAAAVVLGLATIAAGLALGFEGQYRHFHQHNPALLDHLEKALSFC
jgi:MFS family permease